MRLEEALYGRRSLRHFSSKQLPPELLPKLVLAACTAPAPHHSHPWRFLAIESVESRTNLIEKMSLAWQQALTQDGTPTTRVTNLLSRSQCQLRKAPLLLLACLVQDQARSWPDEDRQRSERDMYVHSIGAATQNLMLAAHAYGLASYQMGSPLFCPNAVKAALGLPTTYDPHLLIAIGYPESATPVPRTELAIEKFLSRL